MIFHCYVGLPEGRHCVLNQTSNTLVKLVHDLDVHHGNTPECLRRRIRNLSSDERDEKVQYVRANLITIQLVSVLLHLHVGIEYQICRDQQVVPQHAEPLMQYTWGQIKNHEALLEASRIIPLHWAELARLASKLKMHRIGDVFNQKSSMLKGITRNMGH